MKLVDTIEEQALLESLIEHTKPAVPPDCRHLHYLLSTPFRYGAPYPVGSRFRRPGLTPGVFYGSEAAATAIVEMAFHRLLFYADAPDVPWPSNAGEYTAFSVRFTTAAGLDLTKAPLERDRAHWTDRTNYRACQHLAEQARMAGIDVVRYESVRAPTGTGGINLALLHCRAFTSRRPLARQTWRMQLDASGVRALCAAPAQRLGLGRDVFTGDPRITALRWER